MTAIESLIEKRALKSDIALAAYAIWRLADCFEACVRVTNLHNVTCELGYKNVQDGLQRIAYSIESLATAVEQRE